MSSENNSVSGLSFLSFLKDRFFNFVDKSCVLPSTKLRLAGTCRRTDRATVFPGFLESKFEKLSEIFGIFEIRQKFADEILP